MLQGRLPKALSLHGLTTRTHISIRLGSGICSRVKHCKWLTISLVECPHLSTFRSPGALPEAQNSPQKNKYDLYTEGVSIQLRFDDALSGHLLRCPFSFVLDDRNILCCPPSGEFSFVRIRIDG